MEQFSIDNLPWGIFSVEGDAPRVGIAYLDRIIDLTELSELGLFAFDTSVFYESVLNPFIALGKEVTTGARTQVQSWLRGGSERQTEFPQVFVDRAAATLHLPLHIGDYTDFYSSIEHATNVGRLFRDPDNALLPNWKHLPVAYHGRASSIIESGVPIRRPQGQTKPPERDSPVFGPTRELDFELEMAFVIGKDSQLGNPISVDEAEDYIFGLALFNDWSARDIQRWEYVPLGPFLGKNFASSLSPWILPLEALEPFRTPGSYRDPAQSPELLPYLQFTGEKNFDINLEVAITPSGGSETVVTRTNFKYMYWNMAQQLAHHTVNGCNVRVGDLLASGTISGFGEGEYGSLLEMTKGGKEPITLADGSTRSYLQDGDTVTLRGFATLENIFINFGDLSTKVEDLQVR